MHDIKLPPFPLPSFYKEPTGGVLQSMLSHTVWFTMEYKQNQKITKKEQPKKGKRLPYCSDKLLHLLVRAICPPSLSPDSPKPVRPHSLQSQEKSLPQQCWYWAGIWPVLTKHMRKEVRCAREVWGMQHPEERRISGSGEMLTERMSLCLPQNIRNTSF